MKNLISIQQKIVPEIIELLEKRYTILRTIYFNQPLGRRTLADLTGTGERIVRAEVNFLKGQGLVIIDQSGMTVTNEGEEIIDSLKDFIREIKGLSFIEDTIKSGLGFKKVIVVPGNADEDKDVIKEMGRAGALYVKGIIKDNDIIAVTGGTSVNELVKGMPQGMNKSNLLVVPARGGMGRLVEIQASTLAQRLAEKLGAGYKLLHVPDVMSKATFETIINEPSIKDIIESIQNANLLIHGIGRTDEMAKRRGLSDKEFEELTEKGAVGEAFGYYFDKDGNIVGKASTIGLNFENVKNIDNIVAIAGGSGKAIAISAAKSFNKNCILVTDEGAAKEIVKLIHRK
ncbi:central glycolytic regulator protein [Oxobacter pfennigii]|uniref:Central glycolytic regulator protein n=1 Tax=Oxobacter pfennigii TaxID=36849 RepID=A0A0P8W9C5_9CLOT|nr:sugar-binding domain-containing protein [Oxobacter pfennigii]KPU45250.1 central glycolytic regulator protein [Oxobacter pfennigii]